MPVVAVARSRNGTSALLAELATDGCELVETMVRRSVIEELAAMCPDVVVIDGSLADFDALRLCRDVHRSVEASVVVLARAAVGESWVMEALDAGADDVILAEASPAMVRARMSAIVRSAPRRERRPVQLVVGDVVVDVDAHAVLIGGDVVRFPVRLFRTLVELARRPNMVVTCEELLRDVWGLDPLPAHRRRLRVAVSALRRLLGDGADRPHIETVTRVGYRLATVAVPIVAV